MPVFLEQGVDSRDASVPGVFQVLQSEPPVLSIGLLPLEPVFCPNTLTVNELTFPWLNVTTVSKLASMLAQCLIQYMYQPVKVRNELVLIMAHSRSEMCDSRISLFGPAEVRLRYKHMSH